MWADIGFLYATFYGQRIWYWLYVGIHIGLMLVQKSYHLSVYTILDFRGSWKICFLCYVYLYRLQIQDVQNSVQYMLQDRFVVD